MIQRSAQQISPGDDLIENSTIETMISDMHRMGNEKSSMQGFSTHRIGQSWHDDGGSFGNSGTGLNISGIGCNSANCGIQSTGNELLPAQESDRVSPRFEMDYGATDCRSYTFNRRCIIRI